jgi:ubiquinone/menaquinone biosynthesis C-methylase UbiE
MEIFMRDHFQVIYASKAAQYDAMVSREDYEGNILPALEKIRPLTELEVVEMGAGTGRLTRLLSPKVKSIRAFDASQHMLDAARPTLEAIGTNNWTLLRADNRSLAAENDSADLAIAGWNFGHSTSWYVDYWTDIIGQFIQEMQRVLRPGGTAIILETLGTGSETPSPPNRKLKDYYEWLEREKGFESTWIRTDYRFNSVEEADHLTRFFFGDELADRIVREKMLIVPECTGIWWKTF